MCTILKYKNCVGRNFDYETSYKEEIIIIPKEKYDNEYAMIGICTGAVQDPLLYDGMNEFGLVCGGLAFTNNAHYINMEDVDYGDYVYTPYDFVFQILGSFKTVKEAKEHLNKSHIINKQYSDEFPNSDLHWFIADEKESIIVEQTTDGLNIYDGEVMTNNPPYDLMIDAVEHNLENIGYEYREIVEGRYYTRGYQTEYLDGSYTSMGRFERVTYLKDKLEKNSKSNDINETFHLLSSVEQIYGATPVQDKFEYTIYSVVYDMKNKKIWVKTYDKLCPTNYLITNELERIQL